MGTTFRRDGTKFTLSVERRFADPPAKVWKAVTERDLIRRWFPCDVQGEWTQGAELRFEFLEGEGTELSEEDQVGEVLVVDEPRLLMFRWGTHVLRYELSPDGDGCWFTLSHTFEDPAWAARNGAGWEVCLENLDLVLEGAEFVNLAASVWKAKFARLVTEFEPHYGPQTGPPKDHPVLGEDGVG